jgi:hypothetical protein
VPQGNEGDKMTESDKIISLILKIGDFAEIRPNKIGDFAEKRLFKLSYNFGE